MMGEPVKRSGWGAVPAKTSRAMTSGGRGPFFIHWPAMPKGLTDLEMLKRAQRYHMESLGWSDIGYSFAVGRDGVSYELRGLNVGGSHTKGHNSRSYGVLALLGMGEEPSKAQLKGIASLIEWVRLNDALVGSRSDVVVLGHAHAKGAKTACPGNDLRKWAFGYKHVRDFPVLNAPKVSAPVRAVRAVKAKAKVSVPSLLKKGDKGSRVSDLQRLLNLCFCSGLAVDGVYGAATHEAVVSMQTRLQINRDGVYGAKSRGKVLEHVAAVAKVKVP